jgi:hypothetical protein
VNTRAVLKELRELRRAAQDQAQACDKLILGIESSPENDTATIDQSKSELGPRRHCAAVRRMRAQGDPRAFKVGKRHLMTVDAHAEELARVTRARPLAKATAVVDGGNAYDRALAKARAVSAR